MNLHKYQLLDVETILTLCINHLQSFNSDKYISEASLTPLALFMFSLDKFQNALILDLQDSKIEQAKNQLDMPATLGENLTLEQLQIFLKNLILLGYTQNAQVIHQFLYLNQLLSAQINDLDKNLINNLIKASFFDGLELYKHAHFQSDYNEIDKILDNGYFAVPFNADNYLSLKASLVEDSQKSAQRRTLKKSKAVQNFDRPPIFIPITPIEEEDPFEHNFLEPESAAKAYERAEKAFLNGGMHVTHFKKDKIKYKIIYAFKDKKKEQPAIFALKALKESITGAQGGVCVAQELFPDKLEAIDNRNLVNNICICKNTNKANNFALFENEARFLNLRKRYKGGISFSLQMDGFESHFYYQFSQYMPGRSLYDLCFHKDDKGNLIKREFEDHTAIAIVDGIFKELIEIYYLEDENKLPLSFFHCDLKPENIIVNGHFKDGVFIVDTVHLIDYGDSRFPIETGICYYGSPGYQAPEEAKYDFTHEMFSLGVTLAAAFLTKEIYPNKVKAYLEGLVSKGEKQQAPMTLEEIYNAMSDVFKNNGFNDKSSFRGALMDMAQKMVDANPKNRPNRDLFRRYQRKMATFKKPICNTNAQHIKTDELMDLKESFSELSLDDKAKRTHSKLTGFKKLATENLSFITKSDSQLSGINNSPKSPKESPNRNKTRRNSLIESPKNSARKESTTKTTSEFNSMEIPAETIPTIIEPKSPTPFGTQSVPTLPLTTQTTPSGRKYSLSVSSSSDPSITWRFSNKTKEATQTSFKSELKAREIKSEVEIIDNSQAIAASGNSQKSLKKTHTK